MNINIVFHYNIHLQDKISKLKLYILKNYKEKQVLNFTNLSQIQIANCNHDVHQGKLLKIQYINILSFGIASKPYQIKMTIISTRILLLLALLFIKQCHLTESIPTVSPNQKYTSTGSFIVDTTSTYGNSFAAAWNPSSYKINYPASLGFISQVLVFISIKDLYFSLASKQIQFDFRYSVSTTSFILSTYSNLTNRIQKLSFNYLAIVGNYYDDYNLVNFQYSSNISNFISSSVSKTIALYLNSPFNITGGASTLLTYSGINATTTTSQNVIDLFMSSAFFNSTYLQIYVKSKSNISLYVQTIYLNLLAFNNGFYNQPKYASFILQTITGSNFTVSNTSFFFLQSTLVALTAISIQKDSFLNFQIQIYSPNFFTISTSNQNASYTIVYLLALTYYCQYSTPFLYNTTCYDVCPPRYYGDSNNLACNACSYDCYTCSDSSICTSCNSQNDHRIFNNQTNRCVPLLGFYESYSTVCSPCRFDCYICINGGSCMICDDKTQHRVINTSNARCVPIIGYYESNTSIAAKCRFDCLACENGSAYLSCDSQTQFRILNTNDKSCRSLSGYYESNNSVALKCQYDCVTCNNLNKCTQCDNQTQHRVLNSTSGRCVPLSGFYQTSQTNCQRCPTNCLTCNSAVQCSSCVQGYSLNNSTCMYIEGTNGSPNNSNSGSSNIGILLGSIIAAILLTLGITKLIHYFYIKNQDVDDDQSLPEPVNSAPSVTSQSSSVTTSIRSLNQIPISDLNVWHDRDEMRSNHTCVICLDQYSYLKLNCIHYFHVNCIVQWSNRSDTCPFCLKQFTGTIIRLVCRICRKKQKMIAFDNLKEMIQANRLITGLCDRCRIHG